MGLEFNSAAIRGLIYDFRVTILDLLKFVILNYSITCFKSNSNRSAVTRL